MGKRSPWLAACLTLLVSVLSLQGQRAQDKPAPPVRLFPFREGGKEGKWGYSDRHGEVVVPPRFMQALAFSDGLARVATEKGLGYIDARGKVVFTQPDDLRVDWTRPFTEGLAAFSVKGKWGYFDRHGKVVVEPSYDDVRKFSEGLAAVNLGARSAGFPRPWVMRGGKWGFIDKTGRLVIPLQFGDVDVMGFSDGLALVSIGDKSAYIDKTGKVVLTPEYKSDDPKRYVTYAGSFSEGLARIDTSGRHSGYSTGYVGFLDKTGKFAIEPRLDGAGDFSEGLAAVVVGKKWGYMDRRGRIVVRPQFEEAQTFSEGLAAVRRGAHWSYIDKRGKVVITGRFNDAKAFTGGLALVHEGGEFVRTLDGPVYWSGGAWFYINHKGEKVRRYCKDDDHPVLDP
jgi:hypothetical protein